jgi:hypothetical protein
MALQIRLITALLALAAAAVPAGAFAQSPAPPPAEAPPAPPPSYARPDDGIHGRIVSFDGAYSLQVRDDRGYVDNVQLRPGTVINPTGIRLAPGMAVTIHGTNGGSAFIANEIDTPYSNYGSVYGPFDVGPYPVYAYPYPAYPYPVYAYPYPAFSLGIQIGPRFHRW